MSEAAGPPPTATPASRRKLLLYAPLAVAGVAGIGFWAMLRGLQDGSFNPRSIAQKPIPATPATASGA